MKKLLNIFYSKNIIQFLLFTVLFLLVCYFMEYHKILFFRPQGLHYWRQTDSLSFVQCYIINGMRFFHPQILNMQSGLGYSASEFPILYYIAASLSFIFGNFEIILRLTSIIIVFAGFYSLYRMIQILFENYFLSYTLTFLFFSSTVLIYYTNNFLPDAPALGFTLIAWYYFFSFIYKKKYKHIYWSFFFFTISSLLKITFLMNPIAIICIVILSKLNKSLFTEELNNNRKLTSLIISFCISLILVLLWNFWMINYNAINKGDYFTITSVPIWKTSSYTIRDTWDHASHYWFGEYYYFSFFHVLAGLILLSLVFIKKTNKFLVSLTLLLLLGGISYVLLFFEQFKSHDYYFLILIPVIIFLFINSLKTLQLRFPIFFSKIYITMALVILTILSLNYAKLNMHRRYNHENGKFQSANNNFYTITSYLPSIGILEKDIVISIGDITTNASLYFMKHSGWTLYYIEDIKETTINNYIERGAKYIVISDRKYLALNSMQKFLHTKIGDYKGILFYKL